MKYRYEPVDRIPKQLQPEVVYHTEEYELAGLLCACGCGHRITLLVPDSHEVFDEDGYATIRPSIGVFDAPCKSHYILSAGNVQWLPAFTAAQAARIMHTQIERHVARDAQPASWWQATKAALLSLLENLSNLWRWR